MGHDTRVRREGDAIRRRAWGNYLAAMLLNALVPLLPFAVELILFHRIRTDTLLITAIVYLVTVAAASQGVLPMVIFMVVSLLAAVVYGALLVAPDRLADADGALRWGVWIAMALAMVTQGTDRWKLHMINNYPCFPFMEGER